MRPSPQIVSGLLVLVSGVAVLYTVAVRPAESVASEPVVPTTLSSPADLPLPPISGLRPPVQRVLHAAGLAATLTPDEMAQIPPEVARVLTNYGVTLAVPEPLGSGG